MLRALIWVLRAVAKCGDSFLTQKTSLVETSRLRIVRIVCESEGPLDPIRWKCFGTLREKVK